MVEERPDAESLQDIRTRAEEILQEKLSKIIKPNKPVSSEETEKIVHELQVHQIELEIQNEELLRVQTELESSREKYFELYDLAPVGYFTMNEQGFILHSNLTFSSLLGIERAALIRQPLSRYILPVDQEIYYRHRKKLFEEKSTDVFEIRMLRAGRTQFWARIQANEMLDLQGNKVLRAVVSEITQQKQLEEAQLFLLQCGYLREGENFFESLAQYLSQSLGIEYVCIDRLMEDNLAAKTLAVYYEGSFENNVEYTLNQTPCGEVVGKEICAFPSNVRHLFPQDSVLQEIAAESYVGTTLWSFDGRPIGLIALIGKKPLKNTQLIESVLKTVGIRAAGELERKLAEDRIKNLLDEKELLLREIHHRVKNNLLTIMNLLQLQSDTLTEPSALDALLDARGRVWSMLMMYEKLYETPDFKNMSVKNYFSSLVEEIVKLFPKSEKVTIEKTLEDFLLDTNTLLPLGIIVNELITNTMKHAFLHRDGVGTIRIKTALQNGHVTLEIQDDGIGIPESVDLNNSTGFGLQLVGLLTQQLKGSVKILREQGTRFVLEFDIKKKKPASKNE